MLDIAEEYVSKYGSLAPAARAFAHDLMRGDPAVHKAGYSLENAVITTAEAFDITRDDASKLIRPRSESPTQRELRELAESCAYAADPDEVDYEADDSVDALIDYKDALEDRAYSEGAVLDRINAWLSEPEWGSAAGMLEDICAQVRKVRPEQSEAEREAIEPHGYISD